MIWPWSLAFGLWPLVFESLSLWSWVFVLCWDWPKTKDLRPKTLSDKKSASLFKEALKEIKTDLINYLRRDGAAAVAGKRTS